MPARPMSTSAVLLAFLLAAPAAFAQAPPAMPGHTGMQPGAAQGIDHAEMAAAMARMDRAMAAPGTMTGDPDRDLVAMMIPHHQGAIDMARLYLRTGRDPEIRRMARKIIADQQREIRDMRAWQRRHGVEPAPTAP